MSLAQRQRFVRHAAHIGMCTVTDWRPKFKRNFPAFVLQGGLRSSPGALSMPNKGKTPSPSEWFAAVRMRSKPVILPDWSIVPDPYMIPVSRLILSSTPCSRGAQHDPTH
jgi:hypothetical protein